jgi:membrane-bound metal-dependent hydrolase YbcI (DUF457 family)
LPVTPFHAGPGALGKSVVPTWVSFIAFCAVQVAIDFEPLYYLLRDERPVHRFFHSIGGSLVVAVVVAAALGAARRWVPGSLMRVRLIGDDLRMAAIWIGALVGAVSHVLLDFVMHSDVRLFYPSDLGLQAGGFLGARFLYGVCIVCGMAGLGILGWRYRRGS